MKNLPEGRLGREQGLFQINPIMNIVLFLETFQRSSRMKRFTLA